MHKPRTDRISIQLLEEGVPTHISVPARHVRNDVFEVLKPDNYDTEDEVWEFVPGSIVRCVTVDEVSIEEYGLFMRGKGTVWLAVDLVE